MAKDCPGCRTVASDAAKFCDTCGYGFYGPVPKTPGKHGRAVLITLGIALVLIVLSALVNNARINTPEGRAILQEQQERLAASALESHKVEAALISREFVTERLKAPASADFQPVNDAEVNHGSAETYTVISYVDSQNSFGAKIRTRYTCTVHLLENGKWKLLAIDFPPR